MQIKWVHGRSVSIYIVRQIRLHDVSFKMCFLYAFTQHGCDVILTSWSDLQILSHNKSYLTFIVFRKYLSPTRKIFLTLRWGRMGVWLVSGSNSRVTKFCPSREMFTMNNIELMPNQTRKRSRKWNQVPTRRYHHSKHTYQTFTGDKKMQLAYRWLMII